ncbi:stromal cell-derived factor 2-like protein [Paraphysoderma sedebokerense]|nr:stromal cell-derived factor 2-like protein [Paraphysoderma sedebokerense]
MFSEFQAVTCGSIVKLTHASGFKLHSHGVNYGGGSMQQSVTGYQHKDDPNSLWIVKPKYGGQCKTGEPVKCGDTIRLLHSGTKKYLHSHLHTSPLSGNQEVSAFIEESGDGNAGDNWKVHCSTSQWRREEKVEFTHGETNKYLSSSQQYTYPNPIPGQLEVCSVSYSNANTKWSAQEGIYFADNNLV